LQASVYTPLTHPEIAARWFALPNLLYFSPVPILVLLFTFLILKACKQGQDFKPFIYTLALVFLAFTGFVISLWPNIIPPQSQFGKQQHLLKSKICFNRRCDFNSNHYCLYHPVVLGISG
jgi:cytochrome bd-type quinol oxidase subunit 2